MGKDCKCGHSGGRHEEGPPYPCYECGCRGFELARAEHGGGGE
jgi:hypothetical protein